MERVLRFGGAVSRLISVRRRRWGDVSLITREMQKLLQQDDDDDDSVRLIGD